MIWFNLDCLAVGIASLRWSPGINHYIHVQSFGQGAIRKIPAVDLDENTHFPGVCWLKSPASRIRGLHRTTTLITAAREYEKRQD